MYILRQLFGHKTNVLEEQMFLNKLFHICSVFYFKTQNILHFVLNIIFHWPSFYSISPVRNPKKTSRPRPRTVLKSIAYSSITVVILFGISSNLIHYTWATQRITPAPVGTIQWALTVNGNLLFKDSEHEIHSAPGKSPKRFTVPKRS